MRVRQTLREEYKKLKKKIEESFEAVSDKNYNFLEFQVKLHEESSVLEEVQKNLEGAIRESDCLTDWLEQIHYNDRRGDERHCYLVAVRNRKVIVYDTDFGALMNISFHDLNGMDYKLTVLEEIENCKLDLVQTDGSLSTLQYGRKINKYCWEYVELGGKYSSVKEAEENQEEWDWEQIDLFQYELEKVSDIISTWGYKLLEYDLKVGEVKIEQGEVYNTEDSIQLICECISEYENY